MDRRYLLFFVIALSIWLASMAFIEKKWPNARRRPTAEQVPAETVPGGELEGAPDATGEPSTSPEATPRRAEMRPEDSVGSDTPDQPVVKRRPIEDLPLVGVTTKSYVIEFSRVGAVPVSWDIIDPILVIGESGGDKDNEDAAQYEAPENKMARAPLIDRGLNEYELDRPLELFLKEHRGPFYDRELNDVVYDVKRWEKDGYQYLRFTTAEGPESGTLRITKEFVFPDSGFDVRMTVKLANVGEYKLQFRDQDQGLWISLGPGLGYAPTQVKGGMRNRYSYTEPFFRTHDDFVREKPKPGEWEYYDGMGSEIRWAGIHTRYFTMVLIPDANTLAGEGFSAGKSRVAGEVLEAGLANEDDLAFYPKMELSSRPFSIEPGEEVVFAYTLFVAPKQRAILASTEYGLDQMLFAGSWSWFRALCLLLMAMLSGFHGMLGSWGLAIIALVITVRILMLPLTHFSMKSQAEMMAKQAKLKPYLDKINAKHKDNPTKRNQEMMKLYREHNVNPLGMFKGCLWIAVQMPIFFALFRLLSQSFDLRGASFLWIEDLTEPDMLFSMGFSLPFLGEYFNLLPILWAILQMIASKLSIKPSAGGDPTQQAMQKQMMYMMPFFILVVTYNFPSGLALYWLVSTLWQIFQQQFVNKKILGKPSPPATAAEATA